MTWRVTAPLLVLAAACAEVPDSQPSWSWSLPAYVPEPFVPADNPLTPEKARLGRMLFYDKRLSRDGSTSCASCHLQAYAFTSGPNPAVGIDGQIHPRQSQTLTNAVFNARYTWADPSKRSLEAQVRGPLFDEDVPISEMGLNTEAHRQGALDRLAKDPRYVEAFELAFPEDPSPIRFEQIIRALASFQRTLISFESSWDRWRENDEDALSASARRGARIFFGHETSAVCHHCHDGFNLVSQTRSETQAFDEVGYFNLGLYNIDGDARYPQGNQGLFEHTGRPSDRGRFRTPTLRNVGVTAPYMHDGSVATLEDVIDIYDQGGRHIAEGPLAGDGRANPNKDAAMRPLGLTTQDKSDLVSFLESLTDEAFLTKDEFSNPFPEDDNFGP